MIEESQSVRVKQFLVGRLAVFAYAVWDPASREGVLIDPAFETEKILAWVGEAGLRVSHVVNTHAHTDHTAGNAVILAATGAKLAIHRLEKKRLGRVWNKAIAKVLGGGGSPAPDLLLEDGDEIPVGRFNLSVLHTPGHTAGGICLFCEGHLFTGDTLFVGGVGRTDLPGGSEKTLLASIKKRLFSLPDATVVWPGHHYGETPSSTIGREKRTNPFLAG